ncbi:uncharacterized protein si:ch211-113e8.11 [Betta splendens]|uniref:Uncharacterized protein si:ch211-113e8.11 n=1 Tax=Betta splendens TaxID=158456 RepID=A0A6P7MZS1_BETSP|nr:uncharacterized protein si:ch211-113e8.11 [Betta splendens]
MNSLVGYGVSSESDSDGDDDDVSEVTNAGVSSLKESGDEGTAVNKTRNLLESGSASSESGSESDPEEPVLDQRSLPSHSQTTACQFTLTPASLGSATSNKLPPPRLHACSDSSVFTNPFKAQADQKLNALQKHVPLTMQAKPSQIGGKRVCVSYRKDRRCRFGIKCKFAHDSDLQTPTAPTDCHPPVIDEAPVSENAESHTHGSGGGRSQSSTTVEEQQVKRRVGLSNTLIPPKRAMKQYAMQRDRERINMP